MSKKIVVLSGGVGGARFLQGLVQVIPQNNIVVIGNTGDDEEFYGLHVSPDLDIVMYTLAGVVNEKQGWGYKNETYHTMEQLSKLGNDGWFQLGDKDLATHIHRTNLLQKGKTISEVTEALRTQFGLNIKLIPMSDQKVRTKIKTDHKVISFQEYFVKNRAKDTVRAVTYYGSKIAKPAPAVLPAIMQAQAVLLAPSNPIVSIGTILSIPGIRDALRKTNAKIAAISPIIKGTTIKGPADKMMKNLGMEPSALGIAKAYHDFLDVMIIDTQDAALQKNIEKCNIKTFVTNTIMKDQQTKKLLAKTVLDSVRC